MKRTSLYKHIYQTGPNSYTIVKSIKGKRKCFKTCKTIDEAIDYRNRLKANNWEPLPPTPEEIEEKAAKEYYMYIAIHGGKRYYRVSNKHDVYIGTTKSIEEALYFRDLYMNTPKEEIPHISTVDLQTNNPYLEHGLKYPIPERLILPESKTTYGIGSIVKKGETSFHLHHGKKGNGFNSYVCACPTYEMAYYVRQEMNKCDWDMSQLQKIIDDYPRYYTQLLYFYQYITKHKDHHNNGKWLLMLPKEYTDNKLEHILYNRIEDALFERDFLKEHGWDYDLLVETINDEDNPYLDMELPPYPSRKVRNISERDYHEKELTEVMEFIKEDCYSQDEICEKIGITPATLRNWLKNFWNTSYTEFSKLVLNGENPLEVLEKVEQIYQPDLSRALPNNWNNWVSYLKKLNRWQVRKGTETYGVYPSEELAHKISKELQKVDWDKSKLKDIQAKYGHVSKPYSKRWVYKQGRKWAVRRKDKDKVMITYGVWMDKRIAVIARDMYIEYGFTLTNQDWINMMAEWIIEMSDLLPSTMFGKSTIDDIIYLESECEIPHCRQTGSGKYTVQKCIDGSTVYYGTYSEEKAAEVVEFLEDNNWDKNLLQMMKEMGEI